MVTKPEPQPTRWDIYRRLTSNRMVGMLVGTVEAVDASEAIDKAAAEYGVPTTELTAEQRR